MALIGSDVSVATDGEIQSKLREFLLNETEKLLLIAPYVDLNQDLVRVLEDRARANVQIEVIFREDKAGEYSGAEWFSKLSAAGVSFSCTQNLHAKIYLTQAVAMVASMNLTQSSWNNSREIALILESGEAFRKARDYAMRIQSESRRVAGRSSGTSKPVQSPPRAAVSKGHCIRCNTAIPFDASKPYCKPDYERWAEYRNEDFKDKHCHKCGKSTPATMKRPLCIDCFRS